MWWSLPYGETVQSVQVYQGRLVIVSTSMCWYLDNNTGKLTPCEVVYPQQPTPAPTAANAS